MAIFGNQKQLEPQWKAIYKKRLPKRGTSEMFRVIDVALKPKDYDRARFVKDVLSSKNDCDRFVKGLATNKKKIEDQYKKFKEWTDKEKKFLTQLINELETERKFWETKAKSM